MPTIVDGDVTVAAATKVIESSMGTFQRYTPIIGRGGSLIQVPILTLVLLFRGTPPIFYVVLGIYMAIQSYITYEVWRLCRGRQWEVNELLKMHESPEERQSGLLRHRHIIDVEIVSGVSVAAFGLITLIITGDVFVGTLVGVMGLAMAVCLGLFRRKIVRGIADVPAVV